MASVFKPSGRSIYRIEFKDQDSRTRTISSGMKDKRSAEELGRKLEHDAQRMRVGLTPEYPEQTGPYLGGALEQLRRPLGEVVDDYLADMERQGRSDCHRKEQRRLLAALRDDCRWENLSQIRPDGLTKFLASLQREGREARTLNSYRDALHTFLSWCVRQRWLDDNPLADYPKAKDAGKKRKPKRALTTAEFHSLLKLDMGDRHLLYLVAGLSGLRRNEQRQLQRCDLTPIGPNPTWHLRPEITKGRRLERVPMLPECAAAIRPLWEATADGARLWPQWPRHQTFDKDLRRAGINKVDASGRFVTVHSLRYFFCTLVARVLPIQLVRLLMRHRDIRTTCNLYMDLGLTDVNEALLSLPPLWATAVASLPKERSA